MASLVYPTDSLAKVLDDIDRTMIALRQNAVRARDRMAAGSVGSTLIFDVMITLRSQRAEITSRSGTPGLAAYAQQQKGDDQLDVAATFTAVLAAIDAVVLWIETNFPKSGDFLLAQTFGAEGPVDRQFTPATTATLRTQLDSLIATIGA